MTLRLSEDTINAEDVFQNIVEENERHVNLFLAEGLESGLNKVSELLAVDGDVVLRKPVGEEDRATESLLVVNGREELEGDPSDGIVGPLTLVLSHETILEETQRFVRPYADKSLDGQRLQRPDGFVDTSHPSGKFTRTVHVVGLDFGREALLRLEIELDHRLSKWLGVAAERRDDLENSRVECAVDLEQRELAGVIDHDERGMAKESSAKRRTACIGGRVASADELDTVEGNPRLVGGSPESIVLDKLTQEGDGSLCSVFIGGRQVDLITEDDQPSANLGRREHDSVQSLLVLAILLKGLDEEIGRCCAGEVETDNLHVGKLTKSAEQRHSLTRTGRATKKQRLVLGQPGVQDVLVTHSIQRRDDHVGLGNGMSVDFDGRYLILPRRPLCLGKSDVEVDERAGTIERRVSEAGKAADSISERLAVVQRTVASESPYERKEQLLCDEGFNLLWIQGEIGVLGIVLNHVANCLVQKREQSVEHTRDSKVHDVVVVLGFLESGHEEVLLGKVSTEEVGNLRLDSQSLRRALSSRYAVFVEVLERFGAERAKVVLEHHSRRDGIFAEPDHTATTDCGKSGVLQGLDFEHDADIGRQVETLTIGQGEKFVVVQHTVQVLNPFGVDVTVENNPVALGILASEVVDNLSQDAGKETVRPLTCSGVKVSVQRLLGHDLGVDDVLHALNALDLLEGIEQKGPGSGFARTGVTDHHHTVVDLLDLVQLKDLRHPRIVDDQLSLVCEGSDGLLELMQVGGDVLDAREAGLFDLGEYLDIALDQLGSNGFSDALDDNLGLDNLFSPETTIALKKSRALQTSRADEDTLQRTKPKIVVGLLGQSRRALVEERNCVFGQLFGLVETLGVEHDFGDELLVGFGHGNTAEQLLQVVGRVHGDEDTSVGVHAELSSNELGLGLLVFGSLLQAELNVLNLLRDSRQDSLLETVKLVETSPSTNLADTKEDATHGLEVESVVTAEDQCEAAELKAESLDRLRLARSGRPVRRSAEALLESLGEGEEASVCKRRSDKAVGNSEILKTIGERGIGHLDLQALREVALGSVNVAHLKQPPVVSRGGGVETDQLLDGISLMNAFRNELLAFLALDDFKIAQDGVGKEAKHLDLTVVERLQRLATIDKRFLNGRRPDNLSREDNDLTGECLHECIHALLLDLLGFEDGSVLIDSLR
ncbi:hypothetical protein Ct61P_03327 [Colletotrichum tofieldiae]|nr:hypothetical protein Ct61P_03327 [Colletotrichum tofieldiae]